MVTGMAVSTPTLVYAWPQSKADFDKIEKPEIVGDWKFCKRTTEDKNDGKRWQRQCYSKTIIDLETDVWVVFQFFDERHCPVQ